MNLAQVIDYLLALEIAHGIVARRCMPTRDAVTALFPSIETDLRSISVMRDWSESGTRHA